MISFAVCVNAPNTHVHCTVEQTYAFNGTARVCIGRVCAANKRNMRSKHTLVTFKNQTVKQKQIVFIGLRIVKKKPQNFI